MHHAGDVKGGMRIYHSPLLANQSENRAWTWNKRIYLIISPSKVTTAAARSTFTCPSQASDWQLGTACTHGPGPNSATNSWNSGYGRKWVANRLKPYRGFHTNRLTNGLRGSGARRFVVEGSQVTLINSPILSILLVCQPVAPTIGVNVSLCPDKLSFMTAHKFKKSRHLHSVGRT